MTDALIKFLCSVVCLIGGFIIPTIIYFAGYNSHPQDQAIFTSAVIVSGIITIPLGLWGMVYFWKDANKHSHHHHRGHQSGGHHAKHLTDKHGDGHEPAHEANTDHQPAENHSSICYGVDLELFYELSDGSGSVKYRKRENVWVTTEISEDDHLRTIEEHFTRKYWSDPSKLTVRIIGLYRNGEAIPLVET